MDKIRKVKSISIWIFIVPFVAVNTCLILITKFHGIFPNQQDVILNTIPYLDGGASISRVVRSFPTWLIFKPAMFLTSFLLIKYWLNNKEIILYDSINDLSEKINFYKKNDQHRAKIASAGKKKYFKLFNELKTTKYIIDKSMGKHTNLY